MDCIIVDCVRSTTDHYCMKHRLAKENIEKTFASWQVAYGDDYTWEEYLDHLASDYEIGSGDLVMEVAEHLLLESQTQ